MSGGLVVIGGGPAGHAAAMAYRAAGGQGPVRLLSADSCAPYERPPLSKDFLRGETSESDLSLSSLSSYTDQDVELSLDSPVGALDPTAKVVVLSDGRQLEYDACVLATGSSPAELPVPGADHPGVHQLRSLDQARHLRSAATEARSAVIVGSGFIGCEAAASLARRGLTVTVASMEDLPQQGRLGADAGRRIASWLDDLGVRRRGGSAVEAIEGARRVVFDDQSAETGDLVLLASGIEPRAGLAARAGLELNRGRVVVDQHMQTRIPGLYAAGDVAFAFNAAAGRHLLVEHWGEALAMGEIAGSCAAGTRASWSQAPGFWTEIGDRTLKYAAWGDGFDDVRLVDHGGEAFTAWYGAHGTTVGVLTHEADDDYVRGTTLVERGAPLPR